VTGFDLEAVCRAPAIEVFKILHDPARFPDWWAGMDRVERDGDGTVNRYMSEWPDFAYPTSVARTGDGAVRISCLLSDIAQEWLLAPHAEGCSLHVRVELPDEEAHRLQAQRREVGDSLTALVALAEAEA
jgi:hypothetical protein